MNCKNIYLTNAAALALAAAHPALAAPPPGALPSVANIVAGPVVIAQSGRRLTITQSSATAIVNYASFSIASGYTVNFVQPNASAVILNRVTGTDATTIAGSLTANGQVYLINPNGIAITRSGKVTVGGGFVAATLGMTDAEFRGARKAFTGTGLSAGVTNDGLVTIGSGGFAALLGGTVLNSGKVIVPLGKIALGAGEAATLDFSGDGFLQVAVPSSTAPGDGRALVPLVQSSGKLVAEGGAIAIATATAKAAARNAINLSGVVSASSASAQNGTIILDGGPGGSVVIGTALKVYGAGKVVIGFDNDQASNLAFSGKGSLTYLTPDGTAATAAGQSLVINGAPYTLIYDMAQLDAIDGKSGVTGAGVATYGAGGAGNYALAGNLSASGVTYTRPLVETSVGNGSFYGVFEGLGHTISGLKLKATNSDLALFSGIMGTVRDLGLRKVNVTMTLDPAKGPWWQYLVAGLSRTLGNGGVVANSYVTGQVTVNGATAKRNDTFASIGGLVADSSGTIINTLSGVNITSSFFQVAMGGLVGRTTGASAIFNSGATGTVASDDLLPTEWAGSRAVGGLVGSSTGGVVWNSFATGAVSGAFHSTVGGLIGLADNANRASSVISSSYATGAVTGGDQSTVGGLIGEDWHDVSNSYATGTVTAGAHSVAGGLVGAGRSAISVSYASGNVVAGTGSWAGGLAGDLSDLGGSFASITNAYATGNVTVAASDTNARDGGLIGNGFGGAIANVYYSGHIDAPGATVGAVTGYHNPGFARNASYASVYYDAGNNGQSKTIGADGTNQAGHITGLTSVQLRAALPAGFDPSVWAITAGGLPYLQSLGPTR